MFTLNKTELNILENLVKKDNFDSNFNFKGLTTYEMQKGKNHIAPANWAKYKDKLQYFQLVSEIYEDRLKFRKPRSGKNKRKTIGKKFKTRYYVTPIGFLTLLQNLKSDQISDYITTDNLRFLPLILKHSADLYELDNTFYVLLKYALTNIELESIGSTEIRKGEKYKNILNRQIQEKLTLSFMTEQTQMIFLRKFYTFSQIEKVVVDNVSKNINLKNYTELINSVTSHLTFLFYFYLMLLQEDNLLLYKICLDVYELDITNKKPFGKSSKEEWEKFEENILKISKEILPKLKSITKKIKDDPEIIELFDSNITEIESKLLSVDFLEYLSKTMTK